MEPNNQNAYDDVGYRTEVLYVFGSGEEGGMTGTCKTPKVESKFSQILPCFIGEYNSARCDKA